MTTNLLTQFNYNKHRGMLATEFAYKSFKDRFEAAVGKTKQDLILDDSLFQNSTPYQVSNGVAVVDFKGFTVSSASPIEEMIYGVVSMQDFCTDLRQAINDESVTQAVINFDSGGGYTTYGLETCDLIKELSAIKPIYAVCIGGYLCSQAYEIASNCTAIIASPTSIVGCIGTRLENFTYIGASQLSDTGITESTLPDLGVVVTTFQGGTDKTVGSPYIALSNDQKQTIKAQILEMTATFKEMVLENRGDVKDEFMQGQTFTAQQAMDLNTNLIDGTVNSLAEFVQILQVTQFISGDGN